MAEAKNGSHPKALPDYGPARIDPFSGKPFVYHPTSNGFILYGIGINRVDDSGDPKKDDVLNFD